MTVFARSSNDSEYVAMDQERESQNTVPRADGPQTSASGRPASGLSVMSVALTVIGQLKSAGDIQIDGKVEGDIRGHFVKIGNDAVIKGTVFAEGVELAGTIDGTIEAKRVVLTKTARMSGDIIHQSLQIEQGAYFEGNSRQHDGKTASKRP